MKGTRRKCKGKKSRERKVAHKKGGPEWEKESQSPMGCWALLALFILFNPVDMLGNKAFFIAYLSKLVPARAIHHCREREEYEDRKRSKVSALIHFPLSPFQRCGTVQ